MNFLDKVLSLEDLPAWRRIAASEDNFLDRVSVIIPALNEERHIAATLQAVVQSRCHEVIVVDDGSTDGTEEALSARYGARIVYHWQENQGESVARNHGLSIARGEYIALLDSDDVWLPEKLAKQKALLDQRRDVGVERFL